MNELVRTLYTPDLTTARQRFEQGAAGALLDPQLNPLLFELFLLNYCSRGVRMTEPVEGWIFRAGQRCKEIGMTKLGVALEKHAAQEANHHLMMIADTRALVRRWNATQPWPLEAEALLAVAPAPAVEAYVKMHEDVISGSEPYCQLAIEFEIERISVTWGPPFMQQCARVLGPETNASLSFLVEHVEIDQGHTKFNELQLERVLSQNQSFGPALASTGALALDIYGSFVAECLEFARGMHRTFVGTSRNEVRPQVVQA